jgi:AcrR family transcriptional regulator
MSNKKVESIERAIEAAAAMFSDRRYEDVSIAEIATRARCSSATIYEVFETKKGLYRAAQSVRLSRGWDFVRDEGPPSLRPLLNYFSTRIEAFPARLR